MGFRNIFIEHPCRLSNMYNQLIIKQKDSYSIPFEDINTIIIDNNMSSITTSTISKISHYKIALFLCDEKHIPCSITLPFASYYNKLSVIKSQFGMRKKLRGRLWQKIIKSKIINQSQNLKGIDNICYNKMVLLSKSVKEYDSTYCESNSARIYFKIIFNSDFTRRDDNVVNSYLNYGYALVRGVISRDICALGLEPSLGIFHHNKLNAFNLSDDLIEPFRGLIDKFILKSCLLFNDNSIIDKSCILKLLFCDVFINGQYQSLSNAVNIMVSSYQKCCIGNKSSVLLLPKNIRNHSHEYK